MDAVFIDCETTGKDARYNQAFEFAAIPVINGIIRLSDSYHTYIDHRRYNIDSEIIKSCTEKLLNKNPKVPSVWCAHWGGQFRKRIKPLFPEGEKIVLGGKNIGSFDMQFLFQLDPSLKLDEDFSYSYIEIGMYYGRPQVDRKVPHLHECRDRAIQQGAPITAENSHYAFDDALLCAELYCWYANSEILYDRPVEEIDNYRRKAV